MRRRGVALLVGLFFVALGLRPQVVGIGPLLPAIRGDLGLSHAVAGLLGTIPVACMGVFALPAVRLARRVGSRGAVALAVAAIGGLGVVRGVVPGGAALIALTLPVSIGMGLGNALMPAAVKERFPSRPAFATGVYATGINVGSGFAAALAVPVAHVLGGWRGTLIAFSAATAALAGIWLWTSRGEPPHVRPSAPPHALPWRSPLAWRLVLAFALMSTTFYGMNAWLPATYVDRGWSQTSAGELLGLLNVVSVPAGLIVAAVADRVPRRIYLVAGSVVYGGAIVGIELAPGHGFGWLWAALFGFASGTLFPLVMTLPLDVAHEPAGVAAFTAVMLGAGYCVSATSPFVLGAVRDASGSFADALWVLVGTAAGLLVVSATLSRERLRSHARASTITA
jgi:CP family cyanate transporter-like MFS transporter